MIFNNVLFPEPDGPTMATDSPLDSSNVIRFRMTTAVSLICSGRGELQPTNSPKSIAVPYRRKHEGKTGPALTQLVPGLPEEMVTAVAVMI